MYITNVYLLNKRLYNEIDKSTVLTQLNAEGHEILSKPAGMAYTGSYIF